MLASNELSVRISGDVDGLERDLGRLARPLNTLRTNLNNLRNTGGNALNNLNRTSNTAMGGIANRLSNVGNRFRNVGATIARAMGNAADSATAAMGDLGNSMNMARNRVSATFRDIGRRANTELNRVSTTVRSFATNAQRTFREGGREMVRSFTRSFPNLTRRFQSLRPVIAQAGQQIRRFATGARNEINRLAARLPALGRNFRNMARNAAPQLQSLGSTLTASVSVPLLAVGGYALKTSADFEHAMSKIESVSNATGSEMAAFKAIAMEMGAKTKFSAKEAANGIEELAKAGVSTTQILDGGLKGALNLAAAGELELADAAEIASGVLNAFKKDAINVGQAADILAGAANASSTDVMEMKFGLSACSAVASGAGLKFRDTATALAVLAQNYLRGSDAGTSLKTLIMNLNPGTDKAYTLFEKLKLITYDTSKAFKTLKDKGFTPASQSLDDITDAANAWLAKEEGLKIGSKAINKEVALFMAQYGSSKFYDAKGNLKSLTDITYELRKALIKLNPRDRGAAIKNMFGTDAARAATILFNTGSEGVDNMWEAMKKVKAAKTSETKLNNLKGAIESLTGSIETIAITIGLRFMKPLKKVTDIITGLVNKIGTLSPAVQDVIAIIVVVAAAIGPVILVMGMFGAALGAITASMLWVVLVVGLVVAGIVLLAAKTTVFQQLGKAIIPVFKDIAKTLKQFVPLVKAAIGFLAPYVSAILQNVVNYIKSGLMIIRGIFVVIGGLLKGDWGQVWDGIKMIVIGIVGVIGSLVMAWFSYVKMLFATGLAIIYNIWLMIWNKIKLVFTTIWNIIKTIVMTVFNTIKNIFITAWNTIVVILTTAINLIKTIITAGFNMARSIIKTAINAIVGAFKWLYNHNYYFKALVDFVVNAFKWLKSRAIAIWNGIKSGLAAAFNRIKALASSAFNRVRSIVVSIFNRIRSVAYSVWNAIKSKISTVVSGIRSVVSAGFSRVYSVIASKIRAAKSVVSSVAGAIKRVLGGLANSAYKWGSNLIGGFLRGIKSKVKAVKDAVADVAGATKSLLGFHSPAKEGPGKDADKWAPNLMTMFEAGILDSTTKIKRASRKVATTAGQHLNMPHSVGGFSGNTNVTFTGNSFVNDQLADLVMQKVFRKLKNRGY